MKKVNEEYRDNNRVIIILGNHETLMAAEGVYYGLVEAQNIRTKKLEDMDDDDEEEDMQGKSNNE